MRHSLLAHLGRVFDEQVDDDIAGAGLEKDRHPGRLLLCSSYDCTEQFYGCVLEDR